MNQKETVTGFLLLSLLYLLFKPTVESFGGGMLNGQMMRKKVEHGSVPQFYR